MNRSKDEIKNAPEFDLETYRSEDYRSRIGGYYTGLGGYTATETIRTTYDDEPNRL